MLLNVNGASLLDSVSTDPKRSGTARRSESLARNRGKPAARKDGVFITLVRDFEIMMSSSLVQALRFRAEQETTRIRRVRSAPHFG